MNLQFTQYNENIWVIYCPLKHHKGGFSEQMVGSSGARERAFGLPGGWLILFCLQKTETHSLLTYTQVCARYARSSAQLASPGLCSFALSALKTRL